MGKYDDLFEQPDTGQGGKYSDLFDEPGVVATQERPTPTIREQLTLLHPEGSDQYQNMLAELYRQQHPGVVAPLSLAEKVRQSILTPTPETPFDISGEQQVEIPRRPIEEPLDELAQQTGFQQAGLTDEEAGQIAGPFARFATSLRGGTPQEAEELRTMGAKTLQNVATPENALLIAATGGSGPLAEAAQLAFAGQGGEMGYDAAMRLIHAKTPEEKNQAISDLFLAIPMVASPLHPLLRERSKPIRGTPLETPQLSPSATMGPGTVAGDVSAAVNKMSDLHPGRQFTMVPEPRPELAPAPTVEETLARTVQLPVAPPPTQADITRGILDNRKRILNRIAELQPHAEAARKLIPGGERGMEEELAQLHAELNNRQTNPIVHAPPPETARTGVVSETARAPVIPEPLAPVTPPERVIPRPVEPARASEAGGAPPVAIPAEVPAEDARYAGVETPAKPLTATKHAATEAAREDRNLSPVVQAAEQDFPTAWAKSAAELQADPDIGRRLVDQYKARPAAADDVQNAHLLRETIRRQAEYDAAVKAVNDSAQGSPENVDAQVRLAKASQDYYDVHQADRNAGTGTGRGLNARKMLADDQYNLAKMESRRRAANGGRPLNEQQMRETVAHWNKINRLRNSLEAAEREATGNKLKLKIKNNGGFVNGEILGEIADFGKQLYGKGMEYGQWAKEMVRHFGRVVKEHLSALWNHIKESAPYRAWEEATGGKLRTVTEAQARGYDEFDRRLSGGDPFHRGAVDRVVPLDITRPAERGSVGRTGERRKKPLFATVDSSGEKHVGEFDHSIKTEPKLELKPGRIVGGLKDVTSKEEYYIPGDLLGTGMDPKTVKGEKYGVTTYIMYQAAHDQSGVMNVCKFATLGPGGCAEVCLGLEGQGGMPIGRMSRANKTRFFFYDPETFMAKLDKEITNAKARLKPGMTLAIRLNGTSDVPWEKIQGGMKIMEKHPDVQFYDYTKYPPKLRDIPPNYNLTYSYTGEPISSARSWAWNERGVNTAVVFKGGMPAEFLGRPVIDGDATDLRYLDPKDVIVGLHAKGKALRGDTKEFVYETPPQDVAIPYINPQQKARILKTKGEGAIDAIKDSAPRAGDLKWKRGNPNLELNESAQNPRTLSERMKQLESEKSTSGAVGSTGPVPDQYTRAYQTRLRRQTETLKDKIARQDYTKAVRQQRVLDRKTFEMRAEYQRTKTEFDRQVRADELKNRPWLRRAADTAVKAERAIKLTGATIYGKLASAAVTRLGTRPIEQMIQSAIGQIPGLRTVHEAAPLSGFNPAAERAAIGGVGKGIREFGQRLKGDYPAEEIAFGKPHIEPKSILDLPGRAHAAIKAPVQEAERARATTQLEAHALKQGLDLNDPRVKQDIGEVANQEAKRSIFMQDNFISNAWQSMIRTLEQSKTHPTAGFISSKVAQILLPIVKVPTNIALETGTHMFGTVTATAKLGQVMHRGMSTIRPEEANMIMRHYSKGMVGAGLFLTGYFLESNGQYLGGFYQPGKREEGAVAPMGARIAGVDIPSWLLHAPAFIVMQAGATAYHMAHHVNKQGEPDKSAVLGVAKGLVEEIPFMKEMGVVDNLLSDSYEGRKARGNLGTGLVIPQLVKEVAKYTDPVKEPDYRTPKNTLDYFKLGIPGLREQVPLHSEVSTAIKKHRGRSGAFAVP